MAGMDGYPVLLHLRGQRCVVVGGGKVAARKVSGLLDAGAEITVISPVFEDALLTLAASGQLEIRQTVYQAGMLSDLRPLLVFASTNSREVNQRVVEDARTLNILVDSVDDASASGFTGMASFRRGPIMVGVATGGASPLLATHLRERAAAVIGEEYTVLAEWLAELRPLAIQEIADAEQRKAFWRAVLESPMLELLRADNHAEARTLLDRLWLEARQSP